MMRGSSWPLLSAALVLTLAIAIGAAAAEGTASRYIRHDSDKAVIVFVHGVIGDSTATWTNAQTGAYWPDLLLGDPNFVGTSIYVFQYPSPIRGASFTVSEIAEAMYERLEDDNVFKHQKIIFLAHSMGGLVVRQLLLNHREIPTKVPLIYFFGTPTLGSPIAALATLGSRNPQFQNMFPMSTDDTYLANVRLSWVAAKFGLVSICAYETQSTFGKLIVEQSSATNLCNDIKPVNQTHIDMVKPADIKDDIYIRFKIGALRHIRNTDGVQTVDLTRVVDATKIACGKTGPKLDVVDIVDELKFVAGVPEQYVARAEAFPGQEVSITDLNDQGQPPPIMTKSGQLTYYAVRVSVKESIARFQYHWIGAHSDNELRVSVRPSAVLRDFDVRLKLPPNTQVFPVSVSPQSMDCKWQENNQRVTCPNTLLRDDPVIIKWRWDAWKGCPSRRT